MRYFSWVILTSSLAMNTYSDGRIDVGMSYYGLIDHVEKLNVNYGGRVHLENRTRSHNESVEATVGAAYQWDLNDVFGFEFASWYLGHPKLETRSTYQTLDGNRAYETETYRNYQLSMQYQFSARLLFLDDSSYLLMGASRLWEVYDDKEYSDSGFDFGLFSLNSYGRRTKDQFAIGLLKDIQFTPQIKGSLRWQHLYSAYGPVEVVSLALKL